MSVIEVENLFFSYGATSVLQNVSFSIEEREFIAVFGPNGGGKTTLLNLLMGFLKPDGGKVRLLGKAPKSTRHYLGWVPQNFHFDRDFPISVQEVILGGKLKNKGWRFQKLDYKAVEEVLDRVEMKQVLRAPFASLSGGQRQRVLIARALASNPHLLLLDEPTASVDHDAEKAIYKLLNQLREQMTILMVTHDLNHAVESADRLLCVQNKLTEMPKEKVCKHFALGLYHSKENL